MGIKQNTEMTNTIVVLGATGAQGGSVARFFASKGWKVLAGTRNPDGESAKKIASDSITPVKVDLEDREQLTSVFKQAPYLYAVTNFWGLMTDPRGPYQAEVDQGYNIIAAAKQAGVKHLIFSTLESSKEVSKGAIQVPHFDSKGLHEKELQKSGVPYTILRTVFYYQNFTTFFPISEDGKITINMKDSKLPFYDVDDTGGIVWGIVDAGDKYINKIVGAAGDSLTVAEIAKIFSDATGRDIQYNKVSAETFKSFGFPGADELANMFLHFTDYPLDRDINLTKTLYPGLKDFKTYVKENVELFKAKK